MDPYQKLYEEELARNEALTEQLVTAEETVSELEFQLHDITDSRMWKFGAPFRKLISRIRNLMVKIKSFGSFRNLCLKIRSKWIEKRVRASYGTGSFPSQEEAKRQRETVFQRDVTFSVLVPLYNTPKRFLLEMMDSVLHQTYQKWELCLADGSDDAHAYVGDLCKAYALKDRRIKYRRLEKNLGISGNSNACFELATGNYIGLFDHDDVLHPSVLFEYMKAICERDADYIYCDETTFGGRSINHMITLHFKPDFAIDNLRSNNYICHFSVFDRKLLDQTGLFRSEYDGSQDHDLILRLVTVAKRIVHVPKILYYWRSHSGSVAADISVKSYAISAAKGAVSAHLKACGFRGFRLEGTKAYETIFRIRYQLTAQPLISILIPNKDHVKDLQRCIDSILEKSSYRNYEILVLENNSTEQATFDYYESLKENGRIRVLYYEGAFNYAAINNFGADAAQGSVLLLLNNDTEVITRNWMEELLMYAQRDDVGAVGCMLYYEDYTIQHAGVVIGLGAHRTAGHTHYRMGRENLGYMGRLCYAQNVTAVTGACLMTRRSDYLAVGGFSEEFAVALNDVDYCLKLREKGYLNVFTPFAALFHYESRSRGTDVERPSAENAARYERESALFREKWASALLQGDPYYNPNFSLDYSNYVLNGVNRNKS